MKGTYVIKQDGVELARAENLITTEGKKIIASYLAGIAPDWCGAIAIGAGGTAAAVGNTKLSLEFDREETLARAVLFGGGAGGTHRIIAKTTIPAQIAGKIYELGIFSIASAVSSSSPSYVISGIFSDDDWEEYDGADWIDFTGSVESTYSRIGSEAIVLTTTAATKQYRLNLGSVDFSMYGALDKFSFGSYFTTGTISAVTIKFYTDDSNYFSYSPSVSSLVGTVANTYKAAVYNKSLWTATGNPSWAYITSIGIDVASAGTAGLAMDMIRIDDSDEVDANYALVSRSVLGSVITKTAGSEMDIEYYLDI
jgi:hypothetical protein